MKVTGPTGPSAPSAPRPARAATGFKVSSGVGSTAAGAASATSAGSNVAGLSSLMALQGVEDATERRRRAMRRGHGLLDGLDALRVAALGGDDDGAAVQRLARASGEASSAVDDEGLAAVLAQIDLRAAVELAKRDLRRSAA